MNNDSYAQLVEAKENLVLAVLEAHAQRVLDGLKLRDIARAAELDVLTRLPNRLVLIDRLGHAIVNAKRCSGRIALLFIDLNKFKQINDTLGHATGDEVLKVAAHCLMTSVREADTVSRYGGDEFVILLEKISDLADVTAVVKKILSSLGNPNRVAEHIIRLTASVGISTYPDDGDEAEMLLALADRAMYIAKRRGHNNFAFAGNIQDRDPGVSDGPPVLPYEIILADKEQRQKRRRIADEQLVVATVAAQELQAGAEQALRRQTEFMAVLTHELRNPLTPIRHAATLMRQAHRTDDTAVRMHGIISRQVAHLEKLLEDVFDMSRIATGKMRLECESVDIVNTIGQAIDTVKSSVETRRQKLHCTMPDFPVKIVGDPVRLVQIFGNLLDNASKYSPEDGRVEVTVAIDATSVFVRITDTGIGITPDALPNVFGLFVQDKHATRFNGKGLGIGLALVKELVEAHAGIVTAHSDGAGLGSQFTVTLPREPAVSSASS